MRVAIFYESRLGRNDGPPFYWTKNMREMGIEVDHMSSQFLPEKHKGKFDLYIWVDWGEDALSEILPYKPISMKDLHPSIYITSDTHLGFDYRLEKAKEFDYVFCNQKRGVEEFAKGGVHSEWLPHAADLDAYSDTPEAIKKYDVGFVGFTSFEKRAKALDRIFKEFPNFYFSSGKWFEDVAECYRECRVVFNTSAVDDINMRLFEACATGSALVTESVPTIMELDGIDEMCPPFQPYGDLDDAVYQISKVLELPDYMEQLQNRARAWVCNYHTYKHRIERVFGVVRRHGVALQQINQDSDKPYDRLVGGPVGGGMGD